MDIYQAILARNIPRVRQLLNENPRLLTNRWASGMNPFKFAVNWGALGPLNEFLRRNPPQNHINEALVSAARNGHLFIVLRLLNKGVTLNGQRRALRFAALNGRQNIVRELQRRQNLRRHAVNRMRSAATSRRTAAMRGQLGSARIQTGSTYVNGIPVNLRNEIASLMRRNR